MSLSELLGMFSVFCTLSLIKWFTTLSVISVLRNWGFNAVSLGPTGKICAPRPFSKQFNIIWKVLHSAPGGCSNGWRQIFTRYTACTVLKRVVVSLGIQWQGSEAQSNKEPGTMRKHAQRIWHKSDSSNKQTLKSQIHHFLWVIRDYGTTSAP